LSAAIDTGDAMTKDPVPTMLQPMLLFWLKVIEDTPFKVMLPVQVMNDEMITLASVATSPPSVIFDVESPEKVQLPETVMLLNTGDADWTEIVPEPISEADCVVTLLVNRVFEEMMRNADE